jgi:hypothetical protein
MPDAAGVIAALVSEHLSCKEVGFGFRDMKQWELPGNVEWNIALLDSAD